MCYLEDVITNYKKFIVKYFSLRWSGLVIVSGDGLLHEIIQVPIFEITILEENHKVCEWERGVSSGLSSCVVGFGT